MSLRQKITLVFNLRSHNPTGGRSRARDLRALRHVHVLRDRVHRVNHVHRRGIDEHRHDPLLVTPWSAPRIVTAFSMRIGFAHGFVIMFVPVFVPVFVAIHMTATFLFPVKISQVIFAFLLAIMAVSVFTDALIA